MGWPALVLAGLVAIAADAQHPADLTGFWYGQGEPNDRSEMWLAQAGANGDFTVLFRACRKGKATDTLEKGIWWYADGTETVRITQSNNLIVLAETPYKMLFRDGRHQTYSMPNGFVFKSDRVDARFKLSACDLVS